MSRKQPTPVNRDLIKPDPSPAPPIYGKSPLQTALDSGILQYERCIAELSTERDQLLKLCKEAVTFPREYRKHRIAFKKIQQEQKDSMIKLGQRVRDTIALFAKIQQEQEEEK